MQLTLNTSMEGGSAKAVADLGLQPIHLACLYGTYEGVLELTSRRREDINSLSQPLRNIRENGSEWGLRETPVMLASLMGHLEIVQFLVEKGAELMTRYNHVHAHIYAEEHGFASGRRDFYRRISVGREHFDAPNTRKAIYHLLVSPARRSVLGALRGPRADLGYHDFKLAKKGKSIIVYAPVLQMSTDIRMDPNKTIGILTSRRDDEVLQVAYSGWSSGNLQGGLCLDANKWNYIALHKVAAKIDFKFPASGHDNLFKRAEDVYRGRAHAGHVEPCSTCMCFINRLQQYTGLWIFVQGSVGIGPTLATKSKRTNIRYDTFGDVFVDSENEECEEEVIMPNSGTVGSIIQDINATSEQNAVPSSDGSQSFEVTRNYFSPIADDSDIEETSNIEEAIIGDHADSLVVEDSDVENTEHENDGMHQNDNTLIDKTQKRQTMRWQMPNRPENLPTIVHTTPSWKPEDHLTLLTEYKKKTPVYNWPGYPAAPIQSHDRPVRQVIPPPSRTKGNTEIDTKKKLIIEISDDDSGSEESWDCCSLPLSETTSYPIQPLVPSNPGTVKEEDADVIEIEQLLSSGTSKLQKWRYEAPQRKGEPKPTANKGRELLPLRSAPSLHRWRHSPLGEDTRTKNQAGDEGRQYPYLNSRLIL
ncbi:hypothetical protein F5B20DRAFT_585269 [Whalleya microplaca]|nr:hypothetical protein F5B20DRAFT_585269 [Whalleya microplaca]